jgi:hypothetical protein
MQDEAHHYHAEGDHGSHEVEHHPALDPSLSVHPSTHPSSPHPHHPNSPLPTPQSQAHHPAAPVPSPAPVPVAIIATTPAPTAMDTSHDDKEHEQDKEMGINLDHDIHMQEALQHQQHHPSITTAPLADGAIKHVDTPTKPEGLKDEDVLMDIHNAEELERDQIDPHAAIVHRVVELLCEYVVNSCDRVQSKAKDLLQTLVNLEESNIVGKFEDAASSSTAATPTASSATPSTTEERPATDVPTPQVTSSGEAIATQCPTSTPTPSPAPTLVPAQLMAPPPPPASAVQMGNGSTTDPTAQSNTAPQTKQLTVQLGDLVRVFRDDMMTRVLAPAHSDDEKLANVKALTFLFELQPAVMTPDRIIMKLLDNGLEVCEAMIAPLVSVTSLIVSFLCFFVCLFVCVCVVVFCYFFLAITEALIFSLNFAGGNTLTHGGPCDTNYAVSLHHCVSAIYLRGLNLHAHHVQSTDH